MGVVGWMFIVLFTMKVAEWGPVAAWSWWWVTAPLWGLAAVLVALFMIFLIGLLLAHFFSK